jgi:Relaxase/Mobilisation nuclease domain
MIGTISTGKSFFHCLSYCLEDKQKLSEEQKVTLSRAEGLAHLNRAEVLEYNLCFGNKYELADQFRDVQRLSQRVEKPVLHLSLRLSPGESVTRNQLTELGQQLANAFDLKDRQYITILHKDTKEPHIHLVANRVGTSGKALSTSHNYLKMDRLCRRLEKEYLLKEILSARRFLSKEQRLIPRQDRRKEQLKKDIRQTLDKVSDYRSFQENMQKLGYKVLKARGISFIDDKKVKIKGSEVGFSLAKIERILILKQQLLIAKEAEKQNMDIQNIKENRTLIHYHFSSSQSEKQNSQRILPASNTKLQILKELDGLLHDLLKPEDNQQNMQLELVQQKRKRRKKHRISH